VSKLWEYNGGQPRLIRDAPLQGRQSLQITFDPKARYHGAYIASFRLRRDWSAYDALVLDVLNPNTDPVPGYVLIADRAWQEHGSNYWNRHNGARTFPPGRTQWVIPVRGLYRGEAGSRNNDLKRNIDPDSIIRVDFGFGGKGRAGRIVIDHLRLVKTATPDGPAHALYRLEDVEPVGVDIWDTYMKTELARPITFDVTARGDGLTFRFEADRVWGSKLSALAIHRVGDEDATTWLSGQLDKVADEFRGKAVCLDRPAESMDVPAAWQEKGLIAWPVRIEDEVTPNSMPGSAPPAPDRLVVSRLAVCGEFEPFCIALRPVRELGERRLELAPFRGSGRIAAEIGVVRYNTSRGFGNIAYRIRPHTVRPQTSMPVCRLRPTSLTEWRPG